MAKKTKSKPTSQAQKSGLKILREKGLYKPKNSRAEPTKYGRGILRRFADVISGKASVVTAKSEKRGNKGFKEARSYKQGDQSRGTVRVVRNKIIVPTQAGEQARFSKKGVRVTRTIGDAVYVREPFKSSTSTPQKIYDQLQPGDRISVPLNRGRRGVEWMNFTKEEYGLFILPSGSGGSYKGLSDHIQRFRLEKARKRQRKI